MDKKVALVTGASSGIGEETAYALKEKGFVVYGAARRVDRLAKLTDKGIEVIELDVTDDQSMQNCVNTILQKEGRIDVLVNNAGYGSYGAVEDVPIEEAKRQFEVNIFGLARLTQLVLPKMREHKYGKIVNIASVGGRVWTPFGSWYHATKFAVEGLSATMRLEVEPFGIDVIVIEPGGIATEWGAIAADHLQKTSANGAYAEMANRVADGMREMYSGKTLSKPTVISDTIAHAVTVSNPKTRYLVGFGAKPLAFIQKWFGDRIFNFIIKKVYKF